MKRICSLCKMKALDEDVYCRKCGTKLERVIKGPKRPCGHYFKGVICPECGHLSFPSKK